MSIKVQTIYCDDIRKEENGKLIFIGVYTGDLVPESFPAQLSLCSWSRLEGIAEGDHRLTLRLNCPDGSRQDQVGQIKVTNADEFVSIVTSGMPIRAEGPGIIRLDFVVNDEVIEGNTLKISGRL